MMEAKVKASKPIHSDPIFPVRQWQQVYLPYATVDTDRGKGPVLRFSLFLYTSPLAAVFLTCQSNNPEGCDTGLR